MENSRKLAVAPMHVSEVIKRMDNSYGSLAPINALNIECRDEIPIPGPLSTHCRELLNAIKFASSQFPGIPGKSTQLSESLPLIPRINIP